MVRRLTGILAGVGRGDLRPDSVAPLVTSDSALPAQLTAPASGLFLERVFYDDPPRDWPLVPAVACPDADG
jgi:tRNA U38,U39,U40 pseudouridine synthase TruA